MSLSKQLLLLIGLLSVVACSCIPAEQTQVELKLTGKQQIDYKGKGAGAGFMLMSSLGPAGVAVGIAIDQGIAKQIEQTFSQQYQFAQLAQQQASQWLRQFCQQSPQPKCQQTNPLQLTISHYGFEQHPGDNDATKAIIKLSYQWPSETVTTISSEQLEQQPITEPLEQLKTDATVSKQLLMQTFNRLLQQIDQPPAEQQQKQ